MKNLIILIVAVLAAACTVGEREKHELIIYEYLGQENFRIQFDGMELGNDEDAIAVLFDQLRKVPSDIDLFVKFYDQPRFKPTELSEQFEKVLSKEKGQDVYRIISNIKNVYAGGKGTNGAEGYD